jgi:hypothetical protein
MGGTLPLRGDRCTAGLLDVPRRSAMSAQRVRREKSALSNGCEPHPATLQPDATGAVMEVTKWLNPVLPFAFACNTAQSFAVSRARARLNVEHDVRQRSHELSQLLRPP